MMFLSGPHDIIDKSVISRRFLTLCIRFLSRGHVKRARQRSESDKDGICSTCRKRGKKASAGEQVKKHMKHCGMRDKAGDACSGCREEGKSLQHTKLCGYYR